jgi:hypothetical protein
VHRVWRNEKRSQACWSRSLCKDVW